MLKSITDSIRIKLILLLLIATLLPVAASMIVVYSFTAETAKKTAITRNIQLLEESGRSIEQYFKLISKASLYVYTTGQADNTTIYNIIKLKKYDSDAIYKTLYYISTMLEDVYQINLYIENRSTSYLLRNYLLERSTVKEPVLQNISGFVEGYVETTHKSDNYGVEHFVENKNVDVITFHRPIVDVPLDNILGYVSIDIKTTFFENFANKIHENKLEHLYLINNQDNRILYSSEYSKIGSSADFKWLSSVREKNVLQQRSLEYKSNDYNSVLVFQQIKNGYLDILLVKEIPFDIINLEAKKLASKILYVGIVLITAITIVSIFVSFHFTHPIRQLIHHIEEVQMGYLEAEIKTNRTDEFGVLFRQFSKMMNTINNLIIKEYKLEIANRTNELKALLAQINPHFINNTLQSIATRALKQGSKDVYSLISKLGSMLHYSMHNERTVVKLIDEINYCISYLELQKQRFDFSFDYELNICDEAKSIYLPKMTLQPIIENCIKHGMDDTINKGYIQINANKIESDIEIEIIDNGKGLIQEKIKSIEESFNDIDALETDLKSIGLSNVYSRLYLFFDSNIDIKLRNNPGRGLKVVIKIPAIYCSITNPQK